MIFSKRFFSTAVDQLFPKVSSVGLSDNFAPIINQQYKCEGSGVTRILNETKSESAKANLQRWKDGYIRLFGKQNFQLLNDEYLSTGRAVHSAISSFLSGETPLVNVREDENTEMPIGGYLRSLERVWERGHFDRDAYLIESSVYHSHLNYNGVVDCILNVNDRITLVDWKLKDFDTSRVLRLSDTFDDPLQIAAYIGAVNADPSIPITVDCGVLVYLYDNGAPCDCHPISKSVLEEKWKEWMQRLQMFKSLNE